MEMSTEKKPVGKPKGYEQYPDLKLDLLKAVPENDYLSSGSIAKKLETLNKKYKGISKITVASYLERNPAIEKSVIANRNLYRKKPAGG